MEKKPQIDDAVIDNGEELNEDDEGEFDEEELTRQSFRELEKAWLDKPAVLKTHLVSPLHDAAAKGNISRLKELQEDGINLNDVDNAKNTPLHWAAGADHVEAVKWLLAQKVNLNATNLMGDTALHRAVWRQHFNVCKVLLEAGINVNVRNAQGKKAIELVRDVEIGALLMEHDAVYRAEIEKSIRFANADGDEDYGFDIDVEDNNSESLDISDEDAD